MDDGQTTAVAARRLDALSDHIGLTSAVAGTLRAARRARDGAYYALPTTYQYQRGSHQRAEGGTRGSRIRLAHLSAWFVLHGTWHQIAGRGGSAMAPLAESE